MYIKNIYLENKGERASSRRTNFMPNKFAQKYSIPRALGVAFHAQKLVFYYLRIL